MNFTEEDYKTLEKVEDKLYTALYCHFVRIPCRTDLVNMDRIYKKVFKKEDSGMVGGCSHCVMEACKRLGSLYFADKKAYEELEKEEKQPEMTENEPKTQKRTQKAATKKKTATNKKNK